jgi:hypothetical protein
MMRPVTEVVVCALTGAKQTSVRRQAATAAHARPFIPMLFTSLFLFKRHGPEKSPGVFCQRPCGL